MVYNDERIDITRFRSHARLADASASLNTILDSDDQLRLR